MVKIWEEPGIVDPTSWRHAETDDDGITHESRSFVQRTAENLGIPQAKDTVMEGARLAFLGVMWLGSKAMMLPWVMSCEEDYWLVGRLFTPLIQ